MAERLAEVGYVGVSPDLFHRYDGDHDAVARGEARVEIRDDEVIHDFDEVIRFLRSQDYVRSDSIGIIGVCQTGRQPVLYAAHRNDVAAVVALYGGVDGPNWQPTPEQPVPMSELIAATECPVLGQFGEADHIISIDGVRAWRDAFERANKSYRIRVYPRRAARLVQRYDAGEIPPGADRGRMAGHARVLRGSVRRRLGHEPGHVGLRERHLDRV